MLPDLAWDPFEVSELFLHETEPCPLDANDEGVLHRAFDGIQRVELVVHPSVALLCVTTWIGECVEPALDLSLLAFSPLSVRREAGVDFLYCHECGILPGRHSARSRAGLETALYLTEDHRPTTAFRLAVRPAIGVRLLG